MLVQIEALGGIDVAREGYEAYTGRAAVDVKPGDELRQKRLHLVEVVLADTSRFVHDENDVDWTVSWWGRCWSYKTPAPQTVAENSIQQDQTNLISQKDHKAI